VTDEPVADREPVVTPWGEAVTSEEETAAEQVASDISALAAERDQFKDIAVRLQADFENYRKRISTQAGEEAYRATARLVEELLPVLDACEAAFAHGAEQVEPIWSALIGVLQKQGLEAMDLEGKPFDPTEADAVMHEEGDVDVPIVAEVMRTGYRWKGRVLRPAMVKVKG
jgi:molecular chaperone GrpE